MEGEPRVPGLKLRLTLFGSLLLNLFFYSHVFLSRAPEPGWSRRAAAEAEAVAALSCSGHGRAFLDGPLVDGRPACECNTCYSSPDCSDLLPDCPADADSGDPLFLELYWRQHAAGSAVVVSGWHRMSYLASGDNFISVELERHIRLLHQAVGNAVTDGRFIVFGAGSTQLINAAVYALSPDNNTASAPASVVATAPYYALYKLQTILFDFRENEWKGITSYWANASVSSTTNFIEIVTSPNNPDGLMHQSVLGGSSVIYDHAYYWPHYSAIPAPADEDVMLFTISKISGHASSRFGGDPLFLEPYWRQHAASSAVVVSGWHRMSYRASGDNYISVELERHIRLLHQAVGNAVTDGRFIIFGAGSTQLINAAVYALSPDYNASSAPASVVASAPYYAIYKEQTIMFDSREYEWKGITSKWTNASVSSTMNFIEFVTSPNNPDGQMRHSVLRGSAVIHDHAYYWPHYSAIPAPADEDVMLFTKSKISGHASSRFGWAVIKDTKVYQKMVLYMEMNSMGVSRDTQLRILQIVKAILTEIGQGGDIFEFGYKTQKERWHKLNTIISSSNWFSLQQLSPEYCTYFRKIKDPSPAYAWLKCEMKERTDCEAVLRDAGIISRGGTIFEADSRYTRLSLIKTQDDFDQLLHRLEALVSRGVSSI